MRKIIIVLMLALVIVNAHSQSLLNGRKKVAPKKGSIHASVGKNETPKSLYLYENFQSGTMPSAFTILNVDGNTLPPAEMPVLTKAWVVVKDDGIDPDNSCALSSAYEASPKADDWMILPMQTITTGTYLKWKSMVYFGTGQTYEVRIATSIAGTTPTPSDFVNAPIDSIVEMQYEWQQHIVDLDAKGYSNTNIWVAFRNISVGSTDPYETDILFIDDISISKPVNVDISLETINTPFINGTTLPVSGFVRNEGLQNVTSFDVQYSIDGGGFSAPYSVSGVSLAMNDTLTFVHQTPYVFGAIGNYSVGVKISNVNGGVDNDTTNNFKTKSIMIGEDNSTKKVALFEYFGSNNLPLDQGGMFDFYATAMQNFNTNYFTDAVNYSKATFISYQQDPDLYSIPECAYRLGYNQVNTDPSLYMDGQNDPLYNGFFYLDEMYEMPAFFNVTPTKTINGDSMTVNVTIMPYATLNAKFHVAIVEKTTTGNLGASAVTAYKNVLMKMVTGNDGETVAFTNGTPVSRTYKCDMSSTHKEEMSDLMAIVFLQDSASRYVYQSASTDMVLGVETLDRNEMTRIYPNPSRGLVNIETAGKGKIEVYDQIGNKVNEAEINGSSSAMDLGNQPSGCYIVRIITNGSVVSKKLVIQK